MMKILLRGTIFHYQKTTWLRAQAPLVVSDPNSSMSLHRYRDFLLSRVQSNKAMQMKITSTLFQHISAAILLSSKMQNY